MDEFDVAVVVFVRAQGADESDAYDRAARDVQDTLRNEGVMGEGPVDRTVEAVAVLPLDRAASSGYLRTVPGPLAYRYAGLDAPRKGGDDEAVTQR